MTLPWSFCPACKAGFQASDPAGQPRAKCPVCGQPLHMPSGAEDNQGWYYACNKQKVGPFSLADLRQLTTAGQLKSNDMVWQEGMQRWFPVASVPGLVSSGQTAK